MMAVMMEVTADDAVGDAEYDVRDVTVIDLRPRGEQTFEVQPKRARVPIGRIEQRSALSSLVDGARAGQSGAVVLRGAQGSGKTLLLEDAVGMAVDCRVFRASGVEIESGLPYGTLQQLLGVLVDGFEDLPVAQADALRVAFGSVVGAPADPFLVGAALVALLTAAAKEQPVVCLIDDVQWVDAPSANALGFAARRLDGLGVALLFAVTGSAVVSALSGLPEIALAPLSVGESQLLLSTVLPGQIEHRVRERILAEARGNPLVIHQFARSTTVAAMAGGFAVDPGPNESGLAEDLASRVATVTGDAATVLLLCAADPLGDGTVFHKALAAAGLTSAAQRAAENTGLVQIDDRVRFCHPVARQVVYAAASDAARREAHRVLAEVADGTIGADHALWHRARACTGPVEELAAMLEDSSESAADRGGRAAAAAFLERATALSEHDAARVRRALSAARWHHRSGAFAAAIRLVADIESEPMGERESAMSQLVRAEVAWSEGAVEASRELLVSANRLATIDPDLACEASLHALEAAATTGRLSSHGGVRHAAALARSAPPGSATREGSSELLWRAVSSWWSGEAPDQVALAHAIGRLSDDGSAAHGLATRSAMELWDDEAWATLADRAVNHARRTGEIVWLPRALDLRGCLHVLRGEFGVADCAADNAARAAHQIGTAVPDLAAILLTAWRCSNVDTLEWVDRWSRESGRRGDGSAMSMLDHSCALVHNASGRYEQALQAAERVMDRNEPFVSAWAAPEVVEAAVRTGQVGTAARAFERVRSIAVASGAAWALGIERRCAALLAVDGDVDANFTASIAHLERAGMVPDLGRSHLLYGEWLRRQKRRVDARTHLRRALELFDTIGAAAFASRANLELRASGEQARRRSPETIADLTERELQVAELASDGHSNPEIGTQLFISPRTVEYHLHKVFSKLGITSRAQLRGAIEPSLTGGP